MKIKTFLCSDKLIKNSNILYNKNSLKNFKSLSNTYLKYNSLFKNSNKTFYKNSQKFQSTSTINPTDKSGHDDSFKNSITLNNKNFLINKDLASINISLTNLKQFNLQEKSFIFETVSSIDSVIDQIEKEYNLKINITNEEKSIISKTLAYKDYSSINSSNNNLLKTMQEVLKKLNIKPSDPEYVLVVDLLRENSNINDMKRQYMLVNVELETMDKIKNLIDKKVKFRLNVILLILLIAISYITYIFYNAIYNIDELGWDLVEPTTYLFNCVIFLLCLFAFVKLQRGFYSTTDLYHDLHKSFKIKRYLQYNFNYKKYDKLIVQKSVLMRRIETSSRI